MSSSSLPMVEGRGQAGIRAWGPLILWLLVLAIESTPMMGADHTSGPLERLFTYFHGPYTPVQWWWTHHDIRKTGHFMGYGILAICGFRALWLRVGRERTMLWRGLVSQVGALLGTLAVASCDELHQTFLPNRTGAFADVLLDGAGAVLALLLSYLWVLRSSRLPSISRCL